VLANFVRAQVVVPWASRNTVDSDGDGIADLFDNAPGASNASQLDADGDTIGDIIDSQPLTVGPNLGADPGLGLGAPYTITAGAHAQIDYFVATFTPAGGFGHIDMDLGGDNTFDATYFGPLVSTTNIIDIPPSLFVDPLWNLNLPNAPSFYTFKAKAFGPGMSSQNFAITGVRVVPEPAMLSALLILPLILRRRVSGSSRFGW
jgi:hypothetical protein